jgi:hypothetical protein
MRSLATITFFYEAREDRIAATVNAARPDAWSVWLTRRLTLALLQRTPDFLIQTSDLAKRTPSELSSEVAAFEREAAMAQTASSITPTPAHVLESTFIEAELAERISIGPRDGRFHIELEDKKGEKAGGALTRAELQRILQMLRDVVQKAGWLATAVTMESQAPASAASKSQH